MARIAYLITAYDQPRHLRRLIDALDGTDTRFYVHVDKNTDATPFFEGVGSRNNVRFSPKRFAIRWMGFTQVESILELLHQAVRDGFDYCVLLSGSDYPIKPADHIRSFYAKADQEFLVFWRLEDRPSWKHKVQYFYPIDLIPIWGYSKNLEKVYWRRLFWGRFTRHRHWLPKRTFPFPMVPYGGSDWWSISWGCANHVLRFVEANPSYSRFYRFTHCPSEMFFHTIIMNSEWAARARNFQEYETWSESTSVHDKAQETSMLPEAQFNLRYIDWSGVDTGARETPAILDERDWVRIKDSACLFARKFHQDRSAILIDQIDRNLLNPSLPRPLPQAAFKQ